jgi:transglutaminase-like putative cysteine protease
VRPLDRREKVFSIVMACMQLGVGSTFLFDLRFVPILAGMLILVPKALLELEAEAWCAEPAPAPKLRLPRSAYLTIAIVMGVFFLAFPRIFLGAPLHSFRPGPLDSGTLLDAVLDPTRSGLAQSRRVLLQIQGENIGYLRCYGLTDFDGVRWSAARSGLEQPIQQATPDELARCLHRRVHVKQVAYLGRILPTDGRVVQLNGKFFRYARRNAQGAIQCGYMWNSANNVYEYWIDPQPKPDPLPSRLATYLTRHPPPSARLETWLATVLAGITNQVDQAQRLEAHLRDNFTYQLGAPELNRLNPVDDFLFNQKQGHCERFASTLALLLRLKGIPSRVVIGYLPRGRSWISGWHNVRFADAHAWTEAYFDKLGWVRLDATPAATQPSPGAGLRDLWDTLDLAWSMNIVNFDRGSQRYIVNLSLQGAARLASYMQQHAVLIALLILGLVLLGAGLKFMPRGWRLAAWSSGQQKAQVRAGHYYGQMLRALARRGFPRQPHQTPWEFWGEVQKHKPPHQEDVALITQAFCESRYGNRPISPARWIEITQALRRIIKG